MVIWYDLFTRIIRDSYFEANGEQNSFSLNFDTEKGNRFKVACSRVSSTGPADSKIHSVPDYRTRFA